MMYLHRRCSIQRLVLVQIHHQGVHHSVQLLSQIRIRKIRPVQRKMMLHCLLKRTVECEDVAHNCTLPFKMNGFFLFRFFLLSLSPFFFFPNIYFYRFFILISFSVYSVLLFFSSLVFFSFLFHSHISCRPDISAIRDRAALSSSNPNQLTAIQFQPPALEDLEAPKRQTSLDGEAIKIIIHDVDSGPFLASKRRVILRKDPTDKAHRSN